MLKVVFCKYLCKNKIINKIIFVLLLRSLGGFGSRMKNQNFVALWGTVLGKKRREPLCIYIYKIISFFNIPLFTLFRNKKKSEYQSKNWVYYGCSGYNWKCTAIVNIYPPFSRAWVQNRFLPRRYILHPDSISDCLAHFNVVCTGNIFPTNKMCLICRKETEHTLLHLLQTWQARLLSFMWRYKIFLEQCYGF